MTMMMRLLLLPLCLMHLKEVVGTITFTTDGSLVQTGTEVAMTCKDTEKLDIDIYFGGQPIVSCDLFANLCSVSDPALYSASINKTAAGYNLLTFTIKSFAVSNCGEYTCQKNADTSVNDATTVEHKLSHGESCGTCGQCFPSTLMECSSTCKCNAGYTYDGSACVTTTTTPHPVCDCCCCDNRPKRDGACGTVLGVCICVMAVLVICFYKGFSSKHLEGKIFKLILAIFCLIAALTGLILSAICLSKECCSCSGDSCQAKNCFKGDTIAGFVMTGLSVLGTVVVIILIFLITGESGSGKKKAEAVGLKAK